MVLSAIWKKTRASKFLKDYQMLFEVFEKTCKCVFFQIAREIMLLPINNMKKVIQCRKKVIQYKLLQYLFSALCYLEIVLLLANQIRGIFSTYIIKLDKTRLQSLWTQ